MGGAALQRRHAALPRAVPRARPSGAPDVRDGKDEPSIQQAEPHGGELGVAGDAIGAVRLQQQRVGPIQFDQVCGARETGNRMGARRGAAMPTEACSRAFPAGFRLGEGRRRRVRAQACRQPATGHFHRPLHTPGAATRTAGWAPARRRTSSVGHADGDLGAARAGRPQQAGQVLRMEVPLDLLLLLQHAVACRAGLGWVAATKQRG